jgi:hypothetical protein
VVAESAEEEADDDDDGGGSEEGLVKAAFDGVLFRWLTFSAFLPISFAFFFCVWVRLSCVYTQRTSREG